MHVGAVERCLSIAIFMVLCLTPATQVEAGAIVSAEQRFSLPLPQNLRIPPKAFRQFTLSLKPPARINVRVNVHNAVFNDLNVYLCGDKAFQNFRARLANTCKGVTKGKRQITFSYSLGADAPYHLVLDNSYAGFIQKKATVEVSATITLDSSVVKKLRMQFAQGQKEISKKFDVPEFDIALKPCGMVNAYSSDKGGNITLCSELFFQLYAERLQGAVEAVLDHELAHTLLNLWGLPNYDNEETADEFALVMLFWEGHQQSALDWIKFYGKSDPYAQARNQIQYGDRHPLSVQRIRNIERILHDPQPVIERWNRLAYPHLSRQGLQEIIDNPGAYGDRALAHRVFESRVEAK